MATTTAPRRTKSPNGRIATTAAALRDQRYRLVQLILFAAGAVLMPLGILAIGLGWYGTAHSHYDYDQRTYLISGGILGLGLTFFGGFLYFGALLARMASDQRESTQQLTDTLRLLADLASTGPTTGAIDPAGAAGSALVLAGDGTTVHRRDCPLIAHRDDLQPVTGHETHTTDCRVCRPSAI